MSSCLFVPIFVQFRHVFFRCSPVLKHLNHEDMLFPPDSSSKSITTDSLLIPLSSNLISLYQPKPISPQLLMIFCLTPPPPPPHHTILTLPLLACVSTPPIHPPPSLSSSTMIILTMVSEDRDGNGGREVVYNSGLLL